MTLRTGKPSLLYASLISLAFVVRGVDAHESHETRIQHLEKRLDQLPSSRTSESVALVLRRADLHRRQRDWGAALHDYQHVADAEPENIAMMLGRAQLHLDQHQYALAVFWSTRVLRLHPAHTRAELQHARALAGSGDNDAASIVFDRAINRLEKPRPEHYIEHANMLLAASGNPDPESRAVATLNRGAEALGHPISLHSFAYELERKSGKLDSALNRTDNVLARNGSLLNWRLQRSELLLELERPTDALDELHCLIHHIQQLPEQRRRSRAIQVMMQRSQDLVARLTMTRTATVRSNKAGSHQERESC